MEQTLLIMVKFYGISVIFSVLVFLYTKYISAIVEDPDINIDKDLKAALIISFIPFVNLIIIIFFGIYGIRSTIILLTDKIKAKIEKYKKEKLFNKNPHYETLEALEKLNEFYKKNFEKEVYYFHQTDFSKAYVVVQKNKDHEKIISLLDEYDFSIKKFVSILSVGNDLGRENFKKLIEKTQFTMDKFSEKVKMFEENEKEFEESVKEKTFERLIEEIEEEHYLSKK